MQRLALFLGLVLAGFSVHAESVYEDFNWRADSRFVLKIVQDGVPISIKGELRDDSNTSVTEEGLTVQLRSFLAGFVYIIVSSDYENSSSVIILERENKNFRPMLPTAVRARKVTAFNDMEGIFKSLSDRNQWDVSLSLRKMVEYFTAYPDRLVHHFYTEIEIGNADRVFTPTPAPEVAKVIEPGAPVVKPELNAPAAAPAVTPNVQKKKPVKTNTKTSPPKKKRPKKVVPQQQGLDYFPPPPPPPGRRERRYVVPYDDPYRQVPQQPRRRKRDRLRDFFLGRGG